MKGNLLQGTARGRMGEIVAKVVHGQQVYQKYQPNVNNPKSPKQMKNRDIFAQISKYLKDMRKFLASYGISFFYTTYSGASKNIRNIIYPFCFKHANIFNDNLNNEVLKVNTPLLTDGITGNDLKLFIDASGLVGAFVSQDDAGMGYFGSDKPIAGKALYSAFVSSSQDLQVGKFETKKMELTLESVDRFSAMGLPKAFGVQQSVADCGEWNYIYSGVFGSEVVASCELLPFDNTKKQYATFGVIFDDNSQILLASGINSFKNNP